MKYQTPQLTALMPAIDAVQETVPTSKSPTMVIDSLAPPELNDNTSGYTDWED